MKLPIRSLGESAMGLLLERHLFGVLWLFAEYDIASTTGPASSEAMQSTNTILHLALPALE